MLQALFPDHGDGFCYACLDAFQWDVERTIDALLTDNLPPALTNLNRAMRIKLDVVTMKLKKEAAMDTGVLGMEQRKEKKKRSSARER